jgi:hypothetical protein
MDIKATTADLQTSVGSSYLSTRTTTSGFFQQQLVDSQYVIGAPTNKFLDVFTDSGLVPTYNCPTDNGRVFTITAIAAGLGIVACYDANYATGAFTYRGQVRLTFPNLAATTHTIHGIKVDDSNTSNIKIFITTTGSVVENGGHFVAWKVALSDFTSILSVTIPMATSSDAKAVYFVQNSAAIGTANDLTAGAAVFLDTANSKIYVHNGVAATHQYFKFDYGTAPTWVNHTVTITIATPGVVADAGHSYVLNDQVVLSTTGALPTGLTSGTTYFVTTVVAGVSYNLSLTKGGAAINTSGSQSGTHSIGRAFGITSSQFVLKTGNLPALTGVLLLLNSENYAVPGHTTNSGSACAFFATTTNLYLGKLSELTAAVTTWPSLVTSNLLGAANEVTTPLAVIADWSDSFDRAVFTTSTTKIIAKKVINNVIESIYGVLNNDYLEGVSGTGDTQLTQFGAITIGDLKVRQGWSFMTGTTVGQRGLIVMNHGSDELLDTSYAISKVISTPNAISYIGLALTQQFSATTAHADIYWRSSGFGSATGGWAALPESLMMNAVPPAAQIQFKLESATLGQLVTNPIQYIEAFLGWISGSETSPKWIGSVDNTTQLGASPARTAFRQILTDSGTKYFRAYDDSGNLVVSADTTTNYTQFDKSTNNGTSWSVMTGANDYSSTPLTTEIRYNWTSPPGVRVTCSLGDV